MVDSRSMTWNTWLEERDAAPAEVFSNWLRELVPRTQSEQRAPALNRQPDRLEELSRELFNVQRRSETTCTVQQADLVKNVESMAAMRHSDINAAKVRCQDRLRTEFGPPELLLTFDLFSNYLRQFINELAQNEQGQEIILQSLIVQAHLCREADKAAAPTKQELLDQQEAEELAIAPADDRGPGEMAVEIATPQGRCRRGKKKGSVFRAVCG